MKLRWAGCDISMKVITPMIRAKFTTIFVIHMCITLTLGLLLIPFGEMMFERHPPDGWSYLFWSIYGLIGFPILDASMFKISDGREIGDVLGNFWLLLIPINSVVAAAVILAGCRFVKMVFWRNKRAATK